MHRPSRRALVAIPALVLALGSPALAACSSSGAESSPTVAESPTNAITNATPTDDSNVKQVEVIMTGSKVSPAPGKIKVDKGTEMKVSVMRDTPGEVHVHGYDLEKVAKAGEPVMFDFVADQEGVFEVEAHDPDVLLFQLQVS